MRTWAVVVLLGPFIAFEATGQSFTWEQRASLPATGRWGAFHFEIDGKGYVAGGHNGSAFLSDVWRYDPDTDSWQQRASLPAGRRHGASWSMNGRGYVTCGQVTNTTYSNMLWEYDPIADAWTVKAPLPGQARYGPHGFALNGRGYVGGGNYGSATGPYLSDMWRYDPATDQWTAIGGIPGLARYGSTSFVSGGKGYVHGGRDASLAFSNELWVFDPLLQTWSQAPTMPGPGRSWAMAMPYPFDGVVGCGKDGADNNLHDAYWYYPDIDLWVQIPDYPGASGWSGASFALGERVFGGLGRTILPTNGFYNDFWELVKDAKNGMDELSASGRANLLVHPNPVSSHGTVHMVVPPSWGPFAGQVTIYDATGRVAMETPYLPERPVVLQGLLPGPYVVQLWTRQGTAHGRLVVAGDH